MLIQIYEVSTPQEAKALCALGVDHIGILVGEEGFPREQSLPAAAAIRAAVAPPAKVSALFLSANLDRIARLARALAPELLHLAAAIELMGPSDCHRLKAALPGIALMRSIPVTGEDAVRHAQSYQGLADFLLLDSHKHGDQQIGALGVPHDWRLSARIANTVTVPIILAGGLGPENVINAIQTVRPAGVDSKTKTDIAGTHAKDLARVAAFVRLAKSQGVKEA